MGRWRSRSTWRAATTCSTRWRRLRWRANSASTTRRSNARSRDFKASAGASKCSGTSRRRPARYCRSTITATIRARSPPRCRRFAPAGRRGGWWWHSNLIVTAAPATSSKTLPWCSRKWTCWCCSKSARRRRAAHPRRGRYRRGGGEIARANHGGRVMTAQRALRGVLRYNEPLARHNTWRVRGVRRRRPPTDFEIGYRHVRGPAGEGFIAAELQLQRGDGEAGLARVKELLERRNTTQPIGLPSCGSVFRNPPGDFAARLIESAGLKGGCV